MGFLMRVTTMIVQNNVELRDMGVASSSRTFFQQIGGSFGVSLFGAIFATRLQGALRSQLPGLKLNASGGQFDPRTILRMPPPIRHDVFYAITSAIHGVFIWAAPSALAVFVLGWFINEVLLRGRAPESAALSAEQTAAEPEPAI